MQKLGNIFKEIDDMTSRKVSAEFILTHLINTHGEDITQKILDLYNDHLENKFYEYETTI